MLVIHCLIVLRKYATPSKFHFSHWCHIATCQGFMISKSALQRKIEATPMSDQTQGWLSLCFCCACTMGRCLCKINCYLIDANIKLFKSAVVGKPANCAIPQLCCARKIGAFFSRSKKSFVSSRLPLGRVFLWHPGCFFAMSLCLLSLCFLCFIVKFKNQGELKDQTFA